MKMGVEIEIEMKMGVEIEIEMGVLWWPNLPLYYIIPPPLSFPQ